MLSERRGTTLHLLKHSAKPSTQRERRKKFVAVEFTNFDHGNQEEEKKDTGDVRMNDASFKDVSHLLRTSKRNKTAVNQNPIGQ